MVQHNEMITIQYVSINDLNGQTFDRIICVPDDYQIEFESAPAALQHCLACQTRS